MMKGGVYAATHPKTQYLQEGFAVSVDLNSEFSGWRHDKGDRTFHLFQWPLVFDVAEEWQKEGNCLS